MIISSLLENNINTNEIVQDEFLQLIDEKMELVQTQFNRDFILAERNLLSELMNNSEKVKYGNLSENTEEYQLLQEGAIYNFIKKIKDAILVLCDKIKDIFNSIFKGMTSKRNDTFRMVKYNLKNKNIKSVEKKVVMVDIETSLRDIHIEQCDPIVKQTMIKYDNDIRTSLQNISNEAQVDATIGNSFNTTLDELKNKLGFDDIATLSTNNIDDKINSYDYLSIRISSEDINIAEKDLYMYETRVGTRVEKLKDHTINILSGFMCKKLDELPKNKDIMNTIKSNVDLTNVEGVEQYVITASANLVSQISVIINNITSSYLKAYSHNVICFMNSVKALVLE